jgi:hypothetical protein
MTGSDEASAWSSVRLRAIGRPEAALETVGRRVVYAQDIRVAHPVVRIVGVDDLLELNLGSSETSHEVHGLAEAAAGLAASSGGGGEQQHHAGKRPALHARRRTDAHAAHLTPKCAGGQPPEPGRIPA